MRPIQYNREEVLNKATDLFWERGFQTTTLQEILDATGFNRHSLYENFGNKDGLFHEVLGNYKARFRELTSGILYDVEPDLTSIRKLFELRKQPDLLGYGCLAANTIAEKVAVEPEVFNMAVGFYEEVRSRLNVCLSNALAKGQIPEGKNVEQMSLFVISILYGLGFLSKAGMNSSEAEAIADQTIQFLTMPLPV